jgi:putative (di)nucleoside polyphosphate hydrolase
MADAFFRANVGACVVDEAGRVLALRRRGVADNGWQMPQGGIDDGETPRQAVMRELIEETGLRPTHVELLAEHPDWLAYELPVEFRRPKVGWGQAQMWFLLRARPGAEVVPDGREFDAHEWLTPRELLARVISFRRPVYERVLREFVPGAAGTAPAA